MKIFKKKILISFFVIVFLLLSSVGIYYFFFYDPNIYLEYGNKDAIFSFKYPNTLVITSDLTSLLEVYPKDLYRPYPVFNIAINDISDRDDIRFSKDYFDSWLNKKSKIIETRTIKKDGKIIYYYYFIDKDGRKQRILVTLPKSSFNKGVVVNKNYLVTLSYYGFDEKYDDKIFDVLIKTLKEDNLVGKMVYYEVESKLKMITDSVVSNGKPAVVKEWYYEAEKVFNSWREKEVLNQSDIDKIQKLMDEYRIYLN